MWLLLVIYIAFISLGLPDSMLGSAWPSIHVDIKVPESYAGTITAIIYTGTIISSMASGALIARFGTRNIVLASILLTSLAMYGFSLSGNFLTLCLVALPYGLGGGCIDAALNNYVALHYKAKHMNFLHCFWGIGTMIGPILMGYIISSGGVWSECYHIVAIIQLVIALVVMISLPLWKPYAKTEDSVDGELPKPDYAVLLRPGIRGSVAAFFFYCAIETSMGLWTVTYMIESKGIDIATATTFGMIFFVGITLGRIIAGTVAEKCTDMTLITCGIVAVSCALFGLMLSSHSVVSYIMVGIAGIGCGPIFPCMLHRSPEISGRSSSQTLIGAQMAMASLGSITIPALFGYIVHRFGVSLLPVFCGLMIIALGISLFIEKVDLENPEPVQNDI